jgi:hypothetical protein
VVAFCVLKFLAGQVVVSGQLFVAIREDYFQLNQDHQHLRHHFLQEHHTYTELISHSNFSQLAFFV